MLLSDTDPVAFDCLLLRAFGPYRDIRDDSVMGGGPRSCRCRRCCGGDTVEVEGTVSVGEVVVVWLDNLFAGPVLSRVPAETAPAQTGAVDMLGS